MHLIHPRTPCSMKKLSTVEENIAASHTVNHGPLSAYCNGWGLLLFGEHRADLGGDLKCIVIVCTEKWVPFPTTTGLKDLPRLLPCQFCSINNGTEGTFACQYRDVFPENWVRLKQNSPLECGKYAPTTIKARLRAGLIELHGFSNLRQRTLYSVMFRSGCFSQRYNHGFRRKAAATTGELPDIKNKITPLQKPFEKGFLTMGRVRF